MGSGRHQLRFLHVSDLHLRGSQEKEAWRRRRVLGDSWKRNLETLLNEEGKVDFVFFTGDAVQSGKADEFEEATIFFTELCRELDLDLSRLFVIPGNHDIDRAIKANVWESMRMSLAASPDLLAVSRWMNDIASHPPLGFQASWRASILERQQPYCRWVREYLKRSELAPGGLGYRSTVQLPGWTHPIHIAGLDTS